MNQNQQYLHYQFEEHQRPGYKHQIDCTHFQEGMTLDKYIGNIPLIQEEAQSTPKELENTPYKTFEINQIDEDNYTESHSTHRQINNEQEPRQKDDKKEQKNPVKMKKKRKYITSKNKIISVSPFSRVAIQNKRAIKIQMVKSMYGTGFKSSKFRKNNEKTQQRTTFGKFKLKPNKRYKEKLNQKSNLTSRDGKDNIVVRSKDEKYFKKHYDEKYKQLLDIELVMIRKYGDTFGLNNEQYSKMQNSMKNNYRNFRQKRK